MEEWKEVAGWPGYQVSNMGRVQSYWRELKPILKNGSGYHAVTLHGSPKRKAQFLIHRLVLEAFVGPAPDGFQACHRNAVRTDNRLENLYWGSVAENQADKVRHGNSLRGEKNFRHKLTEDQVRYIKSCSENQPALAKKFGVSQVLISRIRLGKAWAHVQ